MQVSWMQTKKKKHIKNRLNKIKKLTIKTNKKYFQV